MSYPSRKSDRAHIKPCDKPVLTNDDDVNRITRAVQNVELSWIERIGLKVQSDAKLYATN